MGKPLKVGIVGCGPIIGQHLATFRKLETLELVAVADLDPARAQAVADGYTGVRALPVDELLAADDVELVARGAILRGRDGELVYQSRAGSMSSSESLHMSWHIR